MEPWELEAEISRQEQPQLNAIVSREVFMTKFCAVMAKKIIMTANQHNLTTEQVTCGIKIWLDKIQNAGIKFSEGKVDDETD